jgi:Transposase DDE domain
LVEGTGIPLAWAVTGGNRNECTQLIALSMLSRRCAAAPVGHDGAPSGSPLTAPTITRRNDASCAKRGITPEIARRNTAHGSGLGRVRWVVERTFAWLHHFKRLLVRYDRRAEIHEAFLALGCCLVCFRRLARSF